MAEQHTEGKWMPKEPTDEMLAASDRQCHAGKLYPQDGEHGPRAMRRTEYAAMYAVAPLEPAAKDAAAADGVPRRWRDVLTNVANEFATFEAVSASRVLEKVRQGLFALTTQDVGSLEYQGSIVADVFRRAQGYHDELNRCWEVLKVEGQLIASMSLHKALEATLAAAPSAPPGYALVPLRMTNVMRETVEQEGWEWKDLLAAADAITAEQYEDECSDTVAAEWFNTVVQLERMASTAMHQSPGDQRNILEDIAERLSRLSRTAVPAREAAPVLRVEGCGVIVSNIVNGRGGEAVPYGAKPMDALDVIEMLCNGIAWNIETHPTVMNESDSEALDQAREFVAKAKAARAAAGDSIAKAWNVVRKEARAISSGRGFGDLLAAVEAYADRRCEAANTGDNK